MNVSVINRAPVAVLETMDALEDLTEGDNLTLTGFNSNDTANDNLTLVYRWDASHLDTDLDGAKTGDVDHTGQTWTIENLPAGTLTFVLTVIDDDGLSDQKEITVLVAEAPPDGIFETISSAVGTTTALVIGVLGITILGLLASCCSPVEGSRMRRTLGCLNKASLPQTRKPWRPYRKRNRLRNRRPLKQWRLNLNRWKPTGRPSRLQRPSAAVHRFPQPGFQKGGQWSSGTTTASSGSQPINPHLPRPTHSFRLHRPLTLQSCNRCSTIWTSEGRTWEVCGSFPVCPTLKAAQHRPVHPLQRRTPPMNRFP